MIDKFFAIYEDRVVSATQAQALKVVDHVISALGQVVTTSQREYLTQVILDMLAGEDGKVDYEDVGEKVISQITPSLIKGATEALKNADLNLYEQIFDQYGLDLNNFTWLVQTNQVDAMGNVVYDVQELDSNALDAINSLLKMGATVEQVEEAFAQSYSLSDFVTRLNELAEGVKDANKAMGGEDGNLPKTTKEYLSSISSVMDEIEKMQSVVNSIKKDGTFDFDTLLGLAEAHPELLTFTKDVQVLSAALENLISKAKTGEDLTASLKSILLGADNNITGTPFETYGAIGITSLSGVQDWLSANGTPAMQKTFDDWLNGYVQSLIELMTATDDATDAVVGLDKALADMEKADTLQKALDTIFNPEKYSQAEVLQAMVTLRSTLKEIQGEDYSLDTMEEGSEEWLENANIQAEAFIANAEAMAQAYGTLTDAEREAAEAAAKAREEREKYLATMRELADSIMADVEASRAQSSGYAEQIAGLQEALVGGGVEEAVNQWNHLDETIKSGLQSTYPLLVKELAEIAAQEGNVEDHTEALARELNKAGKQANAKYFKDTAKALNDLRVGTKTATQVAKAFRDEEEKVTEAQLEYVEASQKKAEGLEVTADEVQKLAEVLDWTPEALLDAWDRVPSMMKELQASMENMRADMQKEIFLNITGTSEADFSNVLNGLAIVEDSADAAVQALLATGNFEIDKEELTQTMKYPVLNGLFGGFRWVEQTAGSTVQVIKPKGGAGLKTTGDTSKKSGGGGGGGGSQNKGPTEVEIMLDRMQQIQDLQNHSRSLYSAQAGYYEQTGELQGVIKYYQKEIDLIGKQNQTLEDNVAELDTWIQKKKAEVASLKNGTAEYETASKELKDLQKRHQEYSVDLINNRTEVDKLTKAIKEQNDAIRDMEIDLRKTILQAIQDREALNERMLQGQIDLENELLGLIQERYEKERDLILKNAQDQIDALQKERDLLDEQLQLRKEQAEEQDKLTELAELEAKYARISADPTRKKEALSLDKQIKDLREEISWDLAEKEVKAQQDAIDNQITSIEDYMEYVENYYEELFKHPQKLIEEMKTIISQTDEEIMEWLKTNSEEYANKTEATQQDMVAKWQKMIDDMRGAIETYWDEVEAIIEQGDDAIIEFLKENSADYKEAGKLQADAYVDEWLDKLEKLRLAYKQVNGELTDYAYDYVAPSNGSGSGSGGGGSGGSGSGNNHGYSFTYNGQVYTKKGFASKLAAEEAAQKAINDLVTKDVNTSNGTSQRMMTIMYHGSEAKKSIQAYAKGGMAYNTGLAWLDGSPTEPERILSPHQTVLFETLVRSMENMSRIAIPSMPFIDYDDKAGASSVNVGDIIVNVEKMDTDADYEAMAQKVFDALMERLNRGSVVGGIRFSR